MFVNGFKTVDFDLRTQYDFAVHSIDEQFEWKFGENKISAVFSLSLFDKIQNLTCQQSQYATKRDECI